jgi:uncharacterized membrane protein (DUF2068 family)
MPEDPASVAAWEDFVLRLIALYKLSKTLVFIAIGVGLFHLLHHNVEELLRRFVIEPMHFDPDSRLVKWSVDYAGNLTDHKIRLFGYGAFITAAFFATEGAGLYFRQHWAEYMVLFSTGILLPLEVYEMWVHIEWWKAAVLVGNIAILLYLAHRLLLDSQNSARRRAEREARQKAKDQRRNPPGDSPKILPDPS